MKMSFSADNRTSRVPGATPNPSVGSTGDSLGTATPEHGTPLTLREIEVLRLIADGLTNAQIAKRLTLSEKTVKSHVSNILSKLHLADRTQAAVYAYRQGFINP
jgi:Response regulator containing a CheY-like receiver domain and an HTH DNA-binding domain